MTKYQFTAFQWCCALAYCTFFLPGNTNGAELKWIHPNLPLCSAILLGHYAFFYMASNHISHDGRQTKSTFQRCCTLADYTFFQPGNINSSKSATVSCYTAWALCSLLYGIIPFSGRSLVGVLQDPRCSLSFPHFIFPTPAIRIKVNSV